MDSNRKIRIKDIARQGNVSPGTVDRVLHNRGEVSEGTRKKILRIIEEMDFQPNILASALASKKQPLFVTLLPTPLSDDGYWTKPVLGINRRFAELVPYGIRLKSFTFNQYEPEDFNDKAIQALALHPDGMVLAPFFLKESLRFINQLKENHIPFVFIDSDIPGQGQMAYVGQNSFQCGYLSGRLLSMVTGRGKPLLVLHFAKEMDNQNHLLQREKGFYEWFRIHDPHREIKTFEMCVDGLDSCEIPMQEVLADNDPSGIFVTNSRVYMAAGTLEKLGRSDIRLIGHDLLRENVSFLRKGIVDFLICQRPEEQGYDSLDKLFQSVVHKSVVKEHNYTPIDIVMKENVDYYNEFK